VFGFHLCGDARVAGLLLSPEAPPPIRSVFLPPKASPLGCLPSAPPEFPPASATVVGASVLSCNRAAACSDFSRKRRLCRGFSSVGLASARVLAPPFSRLFPLEVRRRLFYSSISCAVDLRSRRRPGAVRAPSLGFRAAAPWVCCSTAPPVSDFLLRFPICSPILTGFPRS
jgi:hypothetical protein